MTRRHWLVLGLCGLIVSAASRVTASSGPVQAEAEGYAGSSVGHWTCGPTARANYGGAGGHARFYVEQQAPKEKEPEEPNQELTPDPDDAVESDPEQVARPSQRQRELEDAPPNLEPHGFSIGAGGGGEYREFTRLACSETPCGPKDVVPPSRLLAAGRANLGWDWDYFGVRAGALAFQHWSNNDDRSPTNAVLPDVDLRFGRRAGFHGGLGFGAYNVATIFRPGAFLAVGYADGRWAADLRGGINLVFDGAIGARGDLSARYAVSSGVAPGLGLAISSATQITPEGRVFIVFTP